MIKFKNLDPRMRFQLVENAMFDEDSESDRINRGWLSMFREASLSRTSEQRPSLTIKEGTESHTADEQGPSDTTEERAESHTTDEQKPNDTTEEGVKSLTADKQRPSDTTGGSRSSMSSKERKLLTIERIFPLDNRELLTYSEKTKRSRTFNGRQQQSPEDNGAINVSKKSHRITSGGYYLYGRPELAEDDRVGHFIYCIMPTAITKGMTICVLHLLQRKFINRKDAIPSYEYASSLLYMKLPSYEGEVDRDSLNGSDNVNNRLDPLNIGAKKKIIQLVKDRNQYFDNVHNVFYEAQLMDRPIKLSEDCKAHITVHQSVAPPYLLSITLRDEFNPLVSSTACICTIPYTNSIYLH
jgi:hypothetical protein